MRKILNILGVDLEMKKAGEVSAKTLKMSKHAKIRTQQRAISPEMVDIVTLFGEPIRRPGNAIEYRINKRDKNNAITMFKKLIHLLDKCSNVSVILTDDMEQVVTVYHQN